MGYPPRLFQEHTWYHVYARGQREEPLFFAPIDRVAYLSFLDRELARRDGWIGSYCLMTNHVHLLIKMDLTPLDDIFQTAHMKYAKYFNNKRDTTGYVFQNRPGMKMVLDDEYLEQLIGYIHRNPVEAGMVDRVVDYEYSSWRWFLRCSHSQEIQCGQYPPGFVGDNRASAFQDVIDEEFDLEGGDNYWGTEEEWEEVDRRDDGREGRRYKERRGRTEKVEIAHRVIVGTGITIKQLQSQSQKRDVSRLRKEAMVRMYEEGYGPTEIGKWFNRTPGSVLYARNQQTETPE